jgi:2-dehydropantoate 2-reductase
MNILLFGRGVIATLYGWAFEKVGHSVTFYVRPGRSAEYCSHVHLDISRTAAVERQGSTLTNIGRFAWWRSCQRIIPMI